MELDIIVVILHFIVINSSICKFNIFEKVIVSKIASYYKAFFYYIFIWNKLFYANSSINITGIEKSIIVSFLIIISWLEIITKVAEMYKTLKKVFNFFNKVRSKFFKFLAIH